MKKTTLALPSTDSRAAALASLAAETGRLAATLRLSATGSSGGSRADDEPAEAEIGAPSDAVAAIPWNPLSFASARAALVEAETALGGRLDEVVVFADPPPGPIGLAEARPAEIERTALEWAAGYAQLLREALRRLAERDGGTVALVLTEADRGPLGAMAAGALAGLAEALAAGMAAGSSGAQGGGSGGAAAVRFIAVRDESGLPDAAARHALRLLDEPPRDPGKVQRFTGRAGLFGR